MVDMQLNDIQVNVIIAVIASIVLLIAISYIYKKYSKNIIQQIPKTIFKTVFGLIVVAGIILIVTWIATATGLTSIFSTLTISGIIGLVITLALQSTLTNILSGFFLIQENILRIGDIITYGGIKGEVVKITYRTVWIKTDNGEITIVSNSTLSAGPFTNHTAKQRLTKNFDFNFKSKRKIQETTERLH